MPTSPSPRPRSSWLASLLMGLLGTVAVAAFAARAQARQAKRAAAGGDRADVEPGAGPADAPEPARPPLPTRTPLRPSSRPLEDTGPVLSVAEIAPLVEAARSSWAADAAPIADTAPIAGGPTGAAPVTAGTVTWEDGEAPVGDVLSSWGPGAARADVTAGADTDAGAPAHWADVVVSGAAVPATGGPASGNGNGTGAAAAPPAGPAPGGAGAPAPVTAPSTPRSAPRADVAAPPRRRWPLAALAAAGLLLALAGGLVVASGGDEAGTDARAGASTSTTAAGTAGTVSAPAGAPGTPVPAAPGTSSPVPADAQAAFTQAASHLEAVGSYAYGGTFRSLDVSAARPSLWLDTEVTVLGEVELRTNRVHETALAPSGVTETLIDDATVYGRSAETAEGLPEASYQVVGEFSGEPGRKGAALVPTWLAAAVGAQPGPIDAQGRATYTAVLPGPSLGAAGGAMPDATMTLTLDGANNPANVLVMSTADDLRISYDLTRLGTPFGITPPA